MRNLATAASATMTAILIGLLVANVASSARAAEIEHGKASKIAALEFSVSSNDTAAQLGAYQQRYTEAYNQLAAAYTTLVQRDAMYRDAMRRSGKTSADLAAANTALEAQLAQAQQALQDAQSAISAWAGRSPVDLPQSGTPAAAPNPSGAAPASPAAAAKPVTSQPTAAVVPGARAPAPTRYCHFDAEGEWQCEDHPW